jgi:hypothetical protein
MKVFNPITKATQDMFDSLNPVFEVSCTYPDIVIGDKGASVRLIVEAEDEEKAKIKATLNTEFTKHLRPGYERYLHISRPSGLYVIGKVDYNEGDPRL